VSIEMPHYRRSALVIAVSFAFSVGVAAQEPVGSNVQPDTSSSAPGWTLTPAFGYAATYDDNVSLFAVRTAEEQNDDFISMYRPALSIDYSGKHSRFGADYSGSLLSYRTFTSLNRWDQHGKITFRRQETARLKWFARGSASALPSTDLIDLGGIPYRHTGARTVDGRGGVEFTISARDGLTSSMMYQVVDFDRAADAPTSLRGGYVLESLNVWRHKFGPRLSVGTDYSLRRAAVTGDVEQFSIHATEGGVDLELSPAWTFSGGAGVAYLESTATTDSRTGPAWRASLERHRGSAVFNVRYVRSFVPSFGFGGTIQNQEAGVGYRTPLFGSRHWYTDQSAVFRDDKPLTSIFQQLPLRSLRTNSVLGWEPQPWMRLEVFYARVQQTSLRFASQLYRNRVGFQIVTSKPMRVS
jgi:hypothetical protein